MSDWKNNHNTMFRSQYGYQTFLRKYAHEGCETWPALAETLVEDVCGALLSASEKDALKRAITDMKFIPGGRYLYYAGRPTKYFNNCLLLKAEEDTREDWANLSWKAESALMTGCGIGVDYSVYRGRGLPLGRTGGLASGPIPKMMMINEIGRNVMQGGSRRSAIYASLAHRHADAMEFLKVKDWHNQVVAGTNGLTIWDLKTADANFPAPLDNTNISLNYDTAWHEHYKSTGDPGSVFRANMRQALQTSEPGFSFNIGPNEGETLRNACCELVSRDDSDVCNLGSLNMGRIETFQEFDELVELATLFLLCGTLRADLPYAKVYETRAKNRRLGLGLMGMHEWILKRGYRYGVSPELHSWLNTYRTTSDNAAALGAARLGVSRPVGVRAIAPTGTIGIIAGTTTGIEPLFSVAVKRRHLENGTEWKETFFIDAAAQELIDVHGFDPDQIESAADLATDPERRIAFQADVQDYVDHAISSTINLPSWGSDANNLDTVEPMVQLLAKYAGRLRGFTCYADASRGGQPMTVVPYRDALAAQQKKVEANDVCTIAGRGTSCGA